MKRILTTLTFCFLLSVPAIAQSGSRVFDNFDTLAGVKIVTPSVKPIAPAKSKKSTDKTKGNKPERTGLENAASTSYVSRISMSSSRTMRGFTTGDEKVDTYILKSAKKHRIDPLLIYSQMHQESAFKQKARSYKGASGLMQLMPATARRFGVNNIFDPEQNIEAGVKYMRWLIDKFNGDLVLALAGYNAGEGAVMKYGWRIPPYRETQEYVRRIAGRYNSITDGNLVKTALRINDQEAKKLDEKEVVPLALYEPNILAVQLSDGRMRLISQ